MIGDPVYGGGGTRARSIGRRGRSGDNLATEPPGAARKTVRITHPVTGVNTVLRAKY